ncbi:hypothetical protein ACP70R_041899 [Stipagrostis hirtigluma subsp. patula]
MPTSSPNSVCGCCSSDEGTLRWQRAAQACPAADADQPSPLLRRRLSRRNSREAYAFKCWGWRAWTCAHRAVVAFELFQRKFPVEIGALVGLKNLNLSRNHLNGRIPETVGNMGSLESLDLSWNELSGAIPQSMASLHLLSHFNMSYNNLSGKEVWWLLVFSKVVSKGYIQFIDSACEKICDWMILLKIMVNRKLTQRNQNSDS